MEEVKEIIDKFLKEQCENVFENEEDINKKAEKMNVLFNFKKILDNYEELEPVLSKYFNEKAEKERFER